MPTEGCRGSFWQMKRVHIITAIVLLYVEPLSRSSLFIVEEQCATLYNTMSLPYTFDDTDVRIVSKNSLNKMAFK